MTQVLIDRATLEKALKLAFNLGQTYWAQADSDYVSQQNKSGGTREKFNQLITDTCAALANAALANAEQVEPEPKLWLWKNFVDGKQEYWVFDNLYPININDDDPQTLGDPCGYALFKPSRNGRKDTL